MSKWLFSGGWVVLLGSSALLAACGSDKANGDAARDASTAVSAAGSSKAGAGGRAATARAGSQSDAGDTKNASAAGSGGKKSTGKLDTGERARADEDAGEQKPEAPGSSDTVKDAGVALRDAAVSDGAVSQGEAPATTEQPTQPASTSSCNAAQAPSIPALALEPVVTNSGLDTLAFAVQPPNSSDWYLVEQRGRILIARDGRVLDTPFLDLQSEIALGAGFDQTTITYDERGLVGLAFAPNYADSGLFYITITPSSPDEFFGGEGGLQQDHDQVLELRRNGSDPDRADTGVVRKLVDVGSSPLPLGNIHNANTVRFGPDGFLYVGMGDGGGVNCGDTEPNASQDVQQQYGKILRLDLSREAPYGAADNPFSDISGAETVLHYGLRNPFRFSFDRATGDLYLGDVGQSTYEEINFASASSRGVNFGWATYEANSSCPGPNRPLRDGSTATPPIFYADRSGFDSFRDYRAIVGGIVYHGSQLPELNGTYIFGDYYGERLGALQHCGDATSPVTGIRKNCDPNFPEPCLQERGTGTLRQLTAIVEDNAGELYIVGNGDSLFRIVRGN
jgi:glucose/arabinose dehydrogenase